MAEDLIVRDQILEVVAENQRKRSQAMEDLKRSKAMLAQAKALKATPREGKEKAYRDLALLHDREKRLEALYFNKDNPDLFDEDEFEDLMKPFSACLCLPNL